LCAEEVIQLPPEQKEKKGAFPKMFFSASHMTRPAPILPLHCALLQHCGPKTKNIPKPLKPIFLDDIDFGIHTTY